MGSADRRVVSLPSLLAAREWTTQARSSLPSGLALDADRAEESGGDDDTGSHSRVGTLESRVARAGATMHTPELSMRRNV